MEKLSQEIPRYQRRDTTKTKSLGSKRLTVVLTDCLKSSPRCPVPFPEMESRLLMYFESFCNSLSLEDTLFDQMMEESVDYWMNEHPTVLNLDLGQLETTNEPVWDSDETEWLDELIEEFDQQTELDSFVNDVDLTDCKYFVKDMKDSAWENVIHDVDWLSDFHLNLLQ